METLKIKNFNNYIIILGAGESGIGAALLARKKKLNVFIYDSKLILKKYKNILFRNNIPFEEKINTENNILKYKNIKIIKSPGILNTSKLIQKIKQHKIPIYSEIDFGYIFSKNSYIISITGSNGKTTTSSIIYKILRNKKINVGLAGNIGNSFSKEVIKKRHFYILEISSFQLDDCSILRPNISILLNITKDHIDVYKNMKNYIKSKFKIALLQNKKGIFVYNYDDPIIRNNIKKYKILSMCIPFSIKEKLKCGAYLKNNKIYYYDIKTGLCNVFDFNINKFNLSGIHNIYNFMASFIVIKILNLNNEIINSSLVKLKPIQHRMEKFLFVNGINFINDSKATNINSVFYALETVKAPILWIAGGLDKGNNYSELITPVKNKVKAIICLGKDNKKIVDFFKNYISCIFETKNIKETVFLVYKLSVSGDTVLLSPGNSSFDLFKNYKEKGDKFKKQIKKIFLHDKKKNIFNYKKNNTIY